MKEQRDSVFGNGKAWFEKYSGKMRVWEWENVAENIMGRCGLGMGKHSVIKGSRNVLRESVVWIWKK